MLKDGTIYLAEITVAGNTRWELLHWGRFATVTPITRGWCNQVGIGMKIDRIERYVPLEPSLGVMLAAAGRRNRAAHNDS